MVEYVSSHFRTKKLETGYSIDLGERFTFTDVCIKSKKNNFK